MTLSQHRVSSSANLTASGASKLAGGALVPAGPPIALDGDAHETLQKLFHQLSQALEALRQLATLVSSESIVLARSSLQKWLQPNARQAEAAMHELRDMRLLKSSVITDLSQSLTVLVLAADMLTQGHLSGADTLAFYDLLQRNTEGALTALAALRTQYGLKE